MAPEQGRAQEDDLLNELLRGVEEAGPINPLDVLRVDPKHLREFRSQPDEIEAMALAIGRRLLLAYHPDTGSKRRGPNTQARLDDVQRAMDMLREGDASRFARNFLESAKKETTSPAIAIDRHFYRELAAKSARDFSTLESALHSETALLKRQRGEFLLFPLPLPDEISRFQHGHQAITVRFDTTGEEDLLDITAQNVRSAEEVPEALEAFFDHEDLPQPIYVRVQNGIAQHAGEDVDLSELFSELVPSQPIAKNYWLELRGVNVFPNKENRSVVIYYPNDKSDEGINATLIASVTKGRWKQSVSRLISNYTRTEIEESDDGEETEHNVITRGTKAVVTRDKKDQDRRVHLSQALAYPGSPLRDFSDGEVSLEAEPGNILYAYEYLDPAVQLFNSKYVPLGVIAGTDYS